MERFVTLFSTGVTEAAVITLVALGFLLIYKATGVINFAQGDLVTLAAYLSLWATEDQEMSFALAYVVTIAAMFVVGVALERFAYAPIRNRSLHVVVVSTLGAALVIRSIVSTWKGTAPRTVEGPFGFTNVWHVGGASIPLQNVLVVAVAGATVAVMILVFSRTAFGRQVRALAVDREAAVLQGIRVSRLSMLTFGLSAALSGMAGLLIAPTQSVTPDLGFSPMLFAFAAAILGGFGRLGGVVVGALAIGLVHQFGGEYLGDQFRDLYPFVLMLGMIALRPQGLFGDEVGQRV